MTTTPLTIGSMFSGMGGLDMAVEAVTGATPAWFCEWEDAPSRVLAHHWPHVPNHRDVTQIDWATMPRVDILTGGYPCQPFSHAGRREGTDDERHLWPHIRQAVRHLRPRLLFLENVAGHRSLGIDRVLGDLAEDGWDTEWCSLRASDIGAPHHRERLFILAYPNGERPQAERLARRPAATLAGDHDCDALLAGFDRAADIGRELRLRWGDVGGRILTWAILHGAPPPVVVDQVTPHPLFGDAFPEHKATLNPEFSEWMMGLPAGHVTDVPDLSRADQLKMIGNGVCPQQGAAALRELLEVTDDRAAS